MARITKEAAHNAAEAITKSLKEAIDSKKAEMREKMYEVVLQHIPKAVMDVYKKHSEYFNNQSSVSLQGNGFNYTTVVMSNKLPLESHYYNINATDAKKIQKYRDDIEDMKKKYESTKLDIENTILALGTHKRVEESLPEAIEFLPSANTNTQLIVNLKPVQKIVKTLTNKTEK